MISLHMLSLFRDLHINESPPGAVIPYMDINMDVRNYSSNIV